MAQRCDDGAGGGYEGEMRAYSNDLRRRIIERIEKGEQSQREIAESFSVSKSFIEKMWQRYRTTGSFEAKPHAGGNTRLLKEYEEVIRGEVKERPDITLAELAEKVSKASGQRRVSLTTMSDELRRLRLPRKKNDIRSGA